MQMSAALRGESSMVGLYKIQLLSSTVVSGYLELAYLELRSISN